MLKNNDNGWKEKSREVCFHWKRGHCFKADECKFSHVGPKGGHQQRQRFQWGQQQHLQGGQLRRQQPSQGGQHQQKQSRPQWGGPVGSQSVHQADVEWLPRLKCQKCDYVMNTQIELVHHMENNHKEARFKCDNCSQAFRNSETLMTHIAQKHTRYQQQENSKASLIDSQINCVDWSCSFCGEKIRGKEVRDSHICQEHPFRLSKNKSQEECRRGANCYHLRTGTCWFGHAQNVERPSGPQEPSRSTRRGDIWCAYQDKCDRRQMCQFKHIDEERDFIQNILRKTGM